MTESFIPFSRVALVGKELEYIAAAMRTGHISGNGSFTTRCHTLLEEVLGVARVLLTTSCTHALEMAALLLRIRTGDEVVVPAYTFVSTVNAFVLHGARPVFIDIRSDTLNLDERQLERRITPRTKAIVPVHYGGVGCEMDTILAIAQRHGVTVVEDNAHGLFGKYKGKFLGTFGQLATQSFHETKNISCGEGGALVINDPQYVAMAEIIREKGTNRSHFLRGEVDRYTWVGLGSSYLPSDLLAAVLYAQLEARAATQARRQQIGVFYRDHLRDWAGENGVRLPIVPPECEQSYHMFYLLMPDLARRQALIAHLRAAGILSVFHYQPLHLSEMGRRYGGTPGQCPVTEDISDRLLRLPFYNDLSELDQARVVAAVRQFRT